MYVFQARRTFQYRDNHQNRLAQPHVELVNCSQGYPLVRGRKTLRGTSIQIRSLSPPFFKFHSCYVMYSALERYLSLKMPSLFGNTYTFCQPKNKFSLLFNPQHHLLRLNFLKTLFSVSLDKRPPLASPDSHLTPTIYLEPVFTRFKEQLPTWWTTLSVLNCQSS